ncbi:MAG: hypothetical protein Q8933_15890 [Bacteroidota bacterium]|nr:hypothetical protein [Bacteroidota bacterium]MDP4190126.1 hypothetical protein [Bacteroidota bacterium]MDP4193741.1 hypothetical protein [Bacteroidota bacterium]
MLILVDAKLPEAAKTRLSLFGELIELKTTGITYEAISGHPDIFFFQNTQNNRVIAAANLPNEYSSILRANGIGFESGETIVGKTYPETAHYNAVISKSYFIHNKKITESRILNSLSESTQIISVKQGYTRCSLLPLKDDCFICSDHGIYKTLKEIAAKVLYVDPKEVILPGFSHGFFGGACGIHENMVFISGSLKCIKDGDKVRDFLKWMDYEIIELYDGPLFDVGSILFLRENK